MSTAMDVDVPVENASAVIATGDKKPRFEVKKVSTIELIESQSMLWHMVHTDTGRNY